MQIQGYLKVMVVRVVHDGWVGREAIKSVEKLIILCTTISVKSLYVKWEFER